VLRQAMPFHVQELFIIGKENGLLIAHAGAGDEHATVNQELISGMIAAIKDFVGSTFVKSPHEDLDEITYGDYNIRLEIQHNFYIAAVIQGVRPHDFSEKLTKLGNRIHNRFYKTIREFDGDARPLAGCAAMLKSFITSYNAAPESMAPKKSKPFLLYAVGAVLLILVIVFGAKYGIPYYKNRQLAQSAQQLLLSDTSFRHEKIQVSAKDGRLILSGSVTSMAKKSRVDSLMRTLPGISDLSNKLLIIKTNEDLEHSIKRVLAPYLLSQNNDIRFIIEEDRVILEGYVPDPLTKQDISGW